MFNRISVVDLFRNDQKSWECRDAVVSDAGRVRNGYAPCHYPESVQARRCYPAYVGITVANGGVHILLLHSSPTGQVLPQVPQFFASYNRSWHPSKQLVSPKEHPVAQCPCTQTCEGAQEILQPPQLYGSVMIFRQSGPQAYRSDGQTMAFVGVGLVRGDSLVRGISVVPCETGVAVSARGAGGMVYDVTSGGNGGRVVTAGAGEGRIFTVPDSCRKYSAASITIITAATMAIPLAAVFRPAGKTSGFPQAVQNFSESSFGFWQREHIHVMFCLWIVFF